MALDSAIHAGDVESVVKILSSTMVETEPSDGLITPKAMWSDLERLSSILKIIDCLEVEDRNRDVLGDVYEYVLSKMSTAGHYGQFRTPRHLIRFVAEAVAPKDDDLVLDPACGTGGFLIAAAELAKNNRLLRLVGEEIDPTISKLARTNVLLHGLENATISTSDSLSGEGVLADVILANPPFAGTVAAGRSDRFTVRTNKTELLFLELMMDRLAQGGRAGVVVPWGVLTSPAVAATEIRKRLVNDFRLKSVVELPSGVFRPYTGVRTAMLFWSNESPAHDVLMIRIENDGFSLDDRREPIAGGELSSALALLRGKSKASNGLLAKRVRISEIAASGWRIGPSAYVDHRPHVGGQIDRADALVLRVSDKIKTMAASAAKLNKLINSDNSSQTVARLRVSEFVDVIKRSVQPESIGDDDRYVGLEHISSESGLWRSVPAGAAKLRSAKYRFMPGDILYGKLRPNLRKCVVVDTFGVCSTDIIVLRPKEEESAHFIAQQMRSEAFAMRAMQMVGGANLPRIHPRDFLEIQLSIPKSLDEARRRSKVAELTQQLSLNAAELSEQMRVLNQSLTQEP
ncbi:MAG: N-6 DNA methylase [Acidimicrobiaceae bacterium]|nr:N-6 DNA methylase [Acidimicrobiaceae bacterium]